jgi:hypothetical protein
MSGLVRVRPDGRNTHVDLAMEYRVLDGGFADAIAALATPSRSGELEREIRGLATSIELARLEAQAEESD